MADEGSGDIDLWALTDLDTNFAIRVAGTLRVAEAIDAGVTKLDDLAARVGADRDALGRLLRYLSRRGLFTQVGPDEFALNDAARRLIPGTPRSLPRWRTDLDGLGARLALPFTRLLDAVRTGEPVHASVFGRPFWEDLAANPQIAEEFHSMMEGPPSGDGEEDGHQGEDRLAGTRHVVDVGGGSGTFLADALRSHPDLRGTLVELPEAAAPARELLAAAGVADRCEIAEQSFFDPLPAGADLYHLSYVIHDWNDRDAVRILRRCAEAVAPDGRVLVEERVRDGSDDADTTGHDLLMLVLTGGRERIVDEFADLAGRAGLRLARTEPSSGAWRLEM